MCSGDFPREQKGIMPLPLTLSLSLSLSLSCSCCALLQLISLTSEGGHLLKDKKLKEFVHYYVVPEDIWKALVTWYGSAGYSSGPPLPRTVESYYMYTVQLKKRVPAPHECFQQSDTGFFKHCTVSTCTSDLI